MDYIWYGLYLVWTLFGMDFIWYHLIPSIIIFKVQFDPPSTPPCGPNLEPRRKTKPRATNNAWSICCARAVPSRGTRSTYLTRTAHRAHASTQVVGCALQIRTVVGYALQTRAVVGYALQTRAVVGYALQTRTAHRAHASTQVVGYALQTRAVVWHL